MQIPNPSTKTKKNPTGEEETFGSLLPGRNYSSSSYKFGFNGKENDNEVHGVTGGWQDYGMRMYDPRIGRFFSVDPITAQYPELTPYQFASNTPIMAIDLDGEERKIVIHRWSESTATFNTKTIYWSDLFPGEDYGGPKGTGTMHYWMQEKDVNPGEGSYHDDGPSKLAILTHKYSLGVLNWGSGKNDDEMFNDKSRVKPKNLLSVDVSALLKVFSLLSVAAPSDLKGKNDGPTSTDNAGDKIMKSSEKTLSAVKESKDIKDESPGYIIGKSKDSSIYYYHIEGNKYSSVPIGEMKKSKLLEDQKNKVVDKLPSGVQVVK